MRVGLRNPMWLRRLGFHITRFGYWVSGYPYRYEPYWEGVCDGIEIPSNRIEHVQKLEKRIHNQRAQLRWWEDLFSKHVHGAVVHGLLEKRTIIRKSVLAIEKSRQPNN